MGGFVARWPVWQEHTVRHDDLDAGGNVSASTMKQWAVEACSEYLDRCVTLQSWCMQSGLRLSRRMLDMSAGTALARPAAVGVSAGVTEIRPRELIMAVRLRALGGDTATVNARCSVTAEDPATGEPQVLSDAVRDELVALEQTAAHVN